MVNLEKIATERRNERTMKIDEMTSLEIVKVINQEDKQVQAGIEQACEEISQVVECAAKVVKNGGRIIYIGAGTSGRLGVLDAVECPPTFGVDYNTVIGLMAGGEDAFVKAKEGAEDREDLAVTDLKQINLSEKDLVVGIAASGRTPYVIGGLKYANSIGASTASIAITSDSEIAKYADLAIEVVVGAEVVTGSTRLKAGTAQKMILNMISTGAMILNGKVYQNLMVDVKQSNIKLQQRARNIVKEATGCDEQTASEFLSAADGSAKVAIVIYLNEISASEARELLASKDGFVRKVVK